MKGKIFVLFFLIIALVQISCTNELHNKYIIEKDNGKIILAYKAFEDFLKSDRSWESYNSILLDAYPQVKVVHDRQLAWGTIDSLKFPEDLKKYEKEDFQHLFTKYSTENIHYLYDSVIEISHTILQPLTKKEIDLCFFLPYGSCFVVPENNKSTIYMSLWISANDAEKIMAHEYSHVLHEDRKPKEALSLKRELVSEGMAVYLTNEIIKDIEFANSIPFMPKESFEWCIEHEQLIKDTIQYDLNDTTNQLFIKYISDGSFAKPPKGFVQKTGYFTGYKIIEACVNRGMTIEEICSLDSQTVIDRSKYFDQ